MATIVTLATIAATSLSLAGTTGQDSTLTLGMTFYDPIPETSFVEIEEKPFCEDGYNLPYSDPYEWNDLPGHATLAWKPNDYENAHGVYCTGRLDEWTNPDYADTDFYRLDFLEWSRCRIVIDCSVSVDVVIFEGSSAYKYVDGSMVACGEGVLFSGSLVGENTIEEIFHPGLYFLSITPSSGDAINTYCPYELRISFEHRRKINSDLNINQLRYERGVEGVIWEADFIPYGLTDFGVATEIEYSGTLDLENDNPDLMETIADRMDNQPVLCRAYYVWGQEAKGALIELLTQAIQSVRAKLDEHENDNDIVVTLAGESKDGVPNFVVRIARAGLSLLEKTIPAVGYLVKAFDFVLGIASQYLEGQIEDAQAYLNYLNTMKLLLEFALKQEGQTVMLPVCYNTSVDGDVRKVSFLASTDYIFSAYHDNVEVGTTLSSLPSDSLGEGSFSYLLDGEVHHSLPEERNTSQVRALCLDSMDTVNPLDPFEYKIFTFKAPDVGVYNVQSHIDRGMELTVTNYDPYSIPPTRSWSTVDSCKPTAGFYSDFYLRKGEEAYIKVSTVDNQGSVDSSDIIVSTGSPHHTLHQWGSSFRASGSLGHYLDCHCGVHGLRREPHTLLRYQVGTKLPARYEYRCKFCGYVSDSSGTGGRIGPLK